MRPIKINLQQKTMNIIIDYLKNCLYNIKILFKNIWRAL